MNIVRVYKVYDEHNMLREVLIPEKYNCLCDSYNESCGGCDNCLLEQYEYYNYKIILESWTETEAYFLKHFIKNKHSMNKFYLLINYCKYYYFYIKRYFIKNV